MEAVIEALLKEGISVDAFSDFACAYGINDDPFVRDVIDRLLVEQVGTHSSPVFQWNTEDADPLLDMLKSPPKDKNPSSPSYQWDTDDADALLDMLKSPDKTSSQERSIL